MRDELEQALDTTTIALIVCSVFIFFILDMHKLVLAMLVKLIGTLLS